jgi:transcriptional regulator with XRE-family HTH domain
VKQARAQVPCRECSGRGYRTRANPAWLRAARAKSGRSLRDLARQLELSAAYLCDIELGRREIETTHRVAEAYRVLGGAKS